MGSYGVSCVSPLAVTSKQSSASEEQATKAAEGKPRAAHGHGQAGRTGEGGVGLRAGAGRVYRKWPGGRAARETSKALDRAAVPCRVIIRFYVLHLRGGSAGPGPQTRS